MSVSRNPQPTDVSVGSQGSASRKWKQIVRPLRPIDEREPIVRYGLAGVVVILALALTVTFPSAGGRPYYFLVGGVILTTWFGGGLPGLISLLLSAALGWWFVLRPTANAALSDGGAATAACKAVTPM